MAAAPDLSRFLLVRGLWLVLLELTVIRVAWTFNFDFSPLPAGRRHLDDRLVHGAHGRRSCGCRCRRSEIGIAVIALHNAVMPRLLPPLPEQALRKVLYYRVCRAGPIGPLMVLYSIVPWIGVMAAGYAFGR